MVKPIAVRLSLQWAVKDSLTGASATSCFSSITWNAGVSSSRSLRYRPTSPTRIPSMKGMRHPHALSASSDSTVPSTLPMVDPVSRPATMLICCQLS
jgi:hypothetical protein